MVVIFADTDKMKIRFFLPFFLVFAFALSSNVALALEYVRFLHLGNERSEEGRVLYEAQDGIAFEARDGQLYVIAREELIARSSDDLPFVAYTKGEMIERLKKEFPSSEGYHYLDMYGPFIVIYTTSRPFANLYGRLLEKLYEQYVQHWKKHGIELSQPEFPLVAFVFSNRERFLQYTKHDEIELLPEQCAYYHKRTNRIAAYDMSGQQIHQERNQRSANAADIQRFLTHPVSYHNIKTIVHEAVHQVGFNIGMHPRIAPSPDWLYEGIATFHETPATQRNTRNAGWTLGPHINHSRLRQLRQYLSTPQLESPIQNMIQNDKLFSRTDTALNNYALAWGVFYYLERKRPKELAAYLKLHQEKTIESEDNDEIRLQDFESCFGNDWDKFYKEFYAFLRRL
jgi:hypothetical protein